MIEDDYLAARIENALGIIESAFQSAVDNQDTSELMEEIARGHGELLAITSELMEQEE